MCLFKYVLGVNGGLILNLNYIQNCIAVRIDFRNEKLEIITAETRKEDCV